MQNLCSNLNLHSYSVQLDHYITSLSGTLLQRKLRSLFEETETKVDEKIPVLKGNYDKQCNWTIEQLNIFSNYLTMIKWLFPSYFYHHPPFHAPILTSLQNISPNFICNQIPFNRYLYFIVPKSSISTMLWGLFLISF